MPITRVGCASSQIPGNGGQAEKEEKKGSKDVSLPLSIGTEKMDAT